MRETVQLFVVQYRLFIMSDKELLLCRDDNLLIPELPLFDIAVLRQLVKRVS